MTQPTKVKVVGTFHVPSTWNPGKSLTANGTAERACYFCRLYRGTAERACYFCRLHRGTKGVRFARIICQSFPRPSLTL